MKKIPVKIALLIPALLLVLGDFGPALRVEEPPSPAIQAVSQPQFTEIADKVGKGETLSAIFKKLGFDVRELPKMLDACLGVHPLRDLREGRAYKFILDESGRIDSFTYAITDDNTLKLSRAGEGYAAQKVATAYEKKIIRIGRTIKNNLIAAMEEGGGGLLVALQLSDIFAGDIDFSTDLRTNDAFKIVIEGLYRDGKFVKYGDILATEFSNSGKIHRAYAFRQAGRLSYYDETGKSLRRSFLKTPLSFRRISSGFSKGRYHPILKIFRPHQGIDYAAASGTPVSAAGDGRVAFAGRRGQYGNLIILKHANGYQTYYGHLSGIARGVRTGARVDQGSVIGYVGSTGLATGPHLHYEMRVNDRPVSPASLKLPHSEPLPGNLRPVFDKFLMQMDSELESIGTENSITMDRAAEPPSVPRG
jgi:murein DD-endopeptidase MepM/ murein hydrolase activator NlpD